MRKCFVSRDVKRQHCLCDELGVIPCRLLFCCYVWTQFCMCRTKVVNIWDFSSITPPKKRLWWKWLNELISLLSVELLRVQCLQWKKNIWSLVKGRRVGGMALNSLCLLKRVSTTVCNLFSWDHITFSVSIWKKPLNFGSGKLKMACYPLPLLWCVKQSYRTVLWWNV